MENQNNESLIHIPQNTLVKTSNLLSITNKLLTQNEYQFKGEIVWEIQAHKTEIINVCTIPNSNLLITIGQDGFAILWDSKQKQPLDSLSLNSTPHDEEYNLASLNVSASCILIRSTFDYTTRTIKVLVLSVDNNTLSITSQRTLKGYIEFCDYNSINNRIYMFIDSSMLILKPHDLSVEKELQFSNNEKQTKITDLSNGRVLQFSTKAPCYDFHDFVLFEKLEIIAYVKQYSIHFININTLQLVNQYVFEEYFVEDSQDIHPYDCIRILEKRLFFKGDETLITTMSRDSSRWMDFEGGDLAYEIENIRIWNIRSCFTDKITFKDIQVEDNNILNPPIKFSSNKKLMLSSEGLFIRIQNAENYEVITNLKHPSDIKTIHHPYSQIDNTLKRTDRYESDFGYVNSYVFGNDNQCVFTGTRNGILRMWK
jgi:WD40 repeat protein